MEKKTCLYDRHVALGALMSPFGGFIMGMQRQYNNSLHLSFPDGFHVMDYDERKNLKMIEEGPGECLTNPEKHIDTPLSVEHESSLLEEVGFKRVGVKTFKRGERIIFLKNI